MAFHDMWGQEGEPEGPSRRPIVKWLALLLGGIVTGAGLYLMLLPGGPLHPALQSARQSPHQSPTTPSTSDTATQTPTVEPTLCLTPAASPPDTVSSFVEALNRGDEDTAWSFLDRAFQQDMYGGQIGAFTSDWVEHGTIELGQITYSQPSSGQADLVARIGLENPPGAQFQYHLRLRYDPAACRWLIREITLPGETTPTGSLTATPTPAAD